jgi:spoIIIJ-associated protein
MVAESHASVASGGSGPGAREKRKEQKEIRLRFTSGLIVWSGKRFKAQGAMAKELIQNGQLDRQAAADALREFLERTIRAAGFQLNVTVTVAAPGAASEAEVIADVDGRDKEILLERGADVLKALEHLAFRALRLEPEHHEKIHVDCGGYRALRFEELRMTAKVAAERVQTSKQPFRLNPMTSRERRIVHLALKDIPGVRTESVGVGEHRQVVIHPADSKPSR